MKRIDCFVPMGNTQTAEALKAEAEVSKVVFAKDVLTKTSTIKDIAAQAEAPFTLIYTKATSLSFVKFALERMLQIAEDAGAAMVYADHFNDQGNAPVIDYQLGALRDAPPVT